MADLGRRTYGDGFFHGICLGIILMGILAGAAR